MNRDIVLVHTSDVHLDAETEARGMGDTTLALTAVLEAARNAQADMLLLAGDIFDSNRQPPAFLERVAKILATAPAPMVVLPGNHDPIVPGAVYHQLHAAGIDRFHVLGLTHPDAVVFEHLDLEVWGRAHVSYGNMAPFESGRERSTRWQIAMGHGHYHSDQDGEALRPSWLIRDHQLAAIRSDYIALGHWNRAAAVGDGRVLAHYSGSPDTAGTVNVVRLRPTGEVLVDQAPLGL